MSSGLKDAYEEEALRDLEKRRAKLIKNTNVTLDAITNAKIAARKLFEWDIRLTRAEHYWLKRLESALENLP